MIFEILLFQKPFVTKFALERRFVSVNIFVCREITFPHAHLSTFKTRESILFLMNHLMILETVLSHELLAAKPAGKHTLFLQLLFFGICMAIFVGIRGELCVP